MRLTLWLLLTCSLASAAVVRDVRLALQANDLATAERLVSDFRKAQGDTPEALAALSWLSRGALSQKRYDKALAYAQETDRLARARLKTHKLDEEENLPIALGAAIEVQSQAMAAQGERAQAVTYLRKQLALYRATSIRARLSKNLNLLTLEGKPAPALNYKTYLGPKPPSLASLRGKPVLLFFWAHWCSDCKAEGPIIAQVWQEFAKDGLVVLGPTQRYGYAENGDDATPAQELKHIDKVRQKYYSPLAKMPVLVDEDTFRNYGASTTPTLVLIDRKGIVRMYHPGALTQQELAAKIRSVLAG